MTQTWTDEGVPERGVTLEVLLAALCFVASAGVTGAVASNDAVTSHTLALLAGWPVVGLAGGIVLDQRPGSRTGRVLTGLSLMPLLVLVWAELRFGGLPTQLDIPRAVSEIAALQVAVVAALLPLSFCTPARARVAQLCAVVAITGGVVAALAQGDVLARDTRIAGWGLAAAGCAAVWLLVGVAAHGAGRTLRRRVTWVLATLGSSGLVIAGAWLLLPDDPAYVVTLAAFVLTAVAITRVSLADQFRPLIEHVHDLLLVLAVVAAASGTALLAGLGASWVSLPSARTSAAFSALVTFAMAVPAALWVRRNTLARRYGTGLISPSDVAVITADLHNQAEPRDLLEKAANIVAAASGSTAASIILGEDAPAVPEHWSVHSLDVGGDRVGFLAVEASDPEGPEPRQEKVVAQLLPTVALVARAVGLAVEAEHARLDVARERDAERKRVLGDLHDGLGPVLAGMSMRVRAALRTGGSGENTELLTDLATDLATSRTDLRRIVAGITPSVLADGNLESALHSLVASFGQPVDGPRVTLDVAVDTNLPPAVTVAVYRSVAEGVTNALRHAAASSIVVRVRSDAGWVRALVVDDGRGGPVVPGVGLSSLAHRASALGGCLKVEAATPQGTRLTVELPQASDGEVQ